VKVAYYSPLPPERSGIADYSALLLPALQRRLEVAVVRRGRKRAPRGTDVSLYHIGNDPQAHGWIVEALRRRPGVVVLHDFVLHHLIAGLTLGRRDAFAYLAAMEREAGLAGRLLAWGVIEKRVAPLWESRPEDFPLATEVLDLARGSLIVHSRYVEQRVRAAGYDGPLWRIPHPAWPVPAVATAPLEGRPLVGCFGHLNTSKRIPQLLEAFARLRDRHAGARLLLVGPIAPRFDLAERLERLRLGGDDAIVREDYVDEARLWSLIAACDVCVSLRAPTMGETSGIAIRALSLGKPLVVSDVGWFAELPDDVALQVPTDEHEVATLLAALELLANDDTVRSTMGAAARALVEREHDVERVAELYAAALEEAAGADAVRDGVLADVTRAAAEVGMGADDATDVRLGERLKEIVGR
jgi:glycosyltransferase involved in cell wall biosynthesis